MQDNFFTELNCYQILKVSGSNAKNFLQGALTCNLNYAKSGKSLIGARCNLKGRVTAILYLFNDGDCWYLVVAQSLVQSLLQDLTKYALFAKTKVEISQDFKIFGIIDQNKNCENKNLLNQQDNSFLLNLFADVFLLICAKNDANNWNNLLAKSYQLKDLNLWNLKHIQNGIAQIEPIYSAKFVPQMLNLPAIGAVSFKKGCYMGQEVVARMQFLGQSKRQMARFFVDYQNLEIGANLFDSNAKTIGELILSANLKTGSEFLAVIDKNTIFDKIYLNNQQVSLLELPYKIDKDAEILR